MGRRGENENVRASKPAANGIRTNAGTIEGPAFCNSFLHDSTSELTVHAQQTLLNLRSWYIAQSPHGGHILET